MEIYKENDQAIVALLSPQDVESAVRQFICTCHPEYAKDWLLNPKYSIGSVIFAGTKA